MEKNLFLRFPQLEESIFDSLDNQTLVKCRKICRSWNKSLTNPKFILMRKIKKTVETRRKFRKPWKTVLKQVSRSTIEQLKAATQEFYGNEKNFAGDPTSITYLDLNETFLH